jgi:hypothetical protein
MSPAPAKRTSLTGALSVLAASVLLWTASGCGSGGETFYPVTGTVQLAGAPLTVGAVSFRPDAARGNTSKHVPTGTIDAEGHFELYTVRRKGAPPGWYKVLVYADANTLQTGGIAIHPMPPRWMMHEKYIDEKTTDLSVEVVERPAAGAYDLQLDK